MFFFILEKKQQYILQIPFKLLTTKCSGIQEIFQNLERLEGCGFNTH